MQVISSALTFNFTIIQVNIEDSCSELGWHAIASLVRS